jgi:methionyl-tRNA synthetase
MGGNVIPSLAQSPNFTPPTKAQQDLFAADVLRYFLLREIPFGQDGSFSFDALIQRYNADLANGYGNLVSRTLNLIHRYQNGHYVKAQRPWLCASNKSFISGDKVMGLEDAFSGTETIIRAICGLEEVVDNYANKSRLEMMASTISLRIGLVDIYLSTYEPWVIAKSSDPESRKKLDEILYTAAESIRIITALLYPILPYATASVWRQLGFKKSIEQAARDGKLKDLQWGGLPHNRKLGPLAPIFPRADKGLAQIMTDMENPAPTPPNDTEADSSQLAAHSSSSNASPDQPSPEALNAVHTPAVETPAVAAPTNNQQPATNNPSPITIDDFAKVDLRVAQIVVAERIPKADKLLRLEVDLGPNFPRRQILAGIAEHYAPEALIGRKVVIVANLAPRKMRGLESQGMVVAASIGPAGAPVLAGFLEDVELGARLK